MKKQKPKQPITDPLRRAITECEVPMLTLEKETGAKRASIARFVRGNTSLRLDIADKLARYFDLELVERKAK